jgi:ADP-dependent NAD(P)H-hydrate dehydratase / NAD(P)H-hydrate epimerase
LIPVLSSAQARAFDAFVGAECSVPSLLLMENAGRAASSILEERLAAGGPRRVAIVCGTGNNGGDGFVVARQLQSRGHSVRVLVSGGRDALAPDARVNRDAWVGIGGALRELPDEPGSADRGVGELGSVASEWSQCDLIVDALLGTGLSRPVTGRYRSLVEAINASGIDVVSLDVPSGLDADTGVALGVAVVARLTITFGHPKTGLLTSVALDHTGELRVADLGVPQRLGPALTPRAHWLDAADVAGWVEARARSTHKGRSGRVLVIGGSPGKTGAAVLSAHAALRAGAGLVTIAAFAAATASLDSRVIEVMTRPIEVDRLEASLDAALEHADAVVIGPGLGLDALARRVVDHVVLGHDGPKLIDADALTLFAGRAHELTRAPSRCLLTPHPAELARLLGSSAKEVEADRFTASERAVALTGQALLLKGPHTLLCEPGAAPWVVSEGHPALAVGGSGDVLSGMTGAFIARLGPLRAGALGAFVHGRAARLWVDAHAGADRGLLARELADFVPQALATLTKPTRRA